MELELNEVVALTVAKCSYSVQNCFYVTDHKFSASGREDVDVQMLGIGESVVVACALKFTHVCVFILRRALYMNVQTPTCYFLICSDVQGTKTRTY